MWAKLGQNIVALFIFAVSCGIGVLNAGFIRENEGIKIQDTQRQSPSEFDGISDHLNVKLYDVRSNETGRSNGTFSGQWDRSGYSMWSVQGQTANVSAYTIEKFIAMPSNSTLIRPTYIDVYLTFSPGLVRWNKTVNSTLYILNETYVALSNTTGYGKGYFELKSNSSGQFSEDETLQENKAKNITKWYTQRNGVMNAHDKFMNILCFEKGHSQSLVDSQPSTMNMQSFTDAYEQSHKLQWSGKFDILLAGRGNTRLFNSTYYRLYDSSLLESPVKETSNSSGYIWENLHTLDMGLPETFNKALPTLLQFIF